MPCRNEGSHISQILHTVPSIVDEIIVVSNASTDDSVAAAQRMGAVVYEDDRMTHGVGYGYAHMTGIAVAKGDIIVGLDADGTYPIEELDTILRYFLDRKIDFLSCSRMERSNMPLKLKLGVQLLNVEARLLYGCKFSDILSGMWVFRQEIRSQISLNQGDWNLSPQIKIEAATSGIEYAEYQIRQKPRFGTSHQRYFRTGLSHARWILMNRIAHMEPWSALQEITDGKESVRDR